MEQLRYRQLHEDVVVEPHIAVQEAHKACHLRAVRLMIGRVPRRRRAGRTVVGSYSDAGQGACEQVVHKGSALCRILDRTVRQKEIVVHQGRAVRYFNENVLSDGTKERPDILCIDPAAVDGQAVVVHQVLRHARSLNLPVEPDSSRAVVNMVSAENNVNRRMHLDAADLGTRQVLFIINMMDVVVLDHREHPAKVSHDSGLTAVMNLTAAHDVAADVLLVPALVAGLQNAVSFGLGSVLVFGLQPLIIVVRLQIFAQGDAGAFRLVDLAVLNDPAFGPVGSDHAVLIGGWRCPLRGRFAHRKAGQGDVSDSLLLREKAVLANREFHLFLIGIDVVKIRIEYRLIRLRILLGIPYIQRELRIPGQLRCRRMIHCAPLCHLIQRFVIQINVSGMCYDRSDEPVSRNPRRVGIVFSKEAVGNSRGPDALCTVNLFPALQLLCAGDDRL